MSIPEALTALKAELSHVFASGFVDLLTQAFADATPIHQVEQQLWDRLLDVGCTCLAAFLDAHGSGDLGELVGVHRPTIAGRVQPRSPGNRIARPDVP